MSTILPSLLWGYPHAATSITQNQWWGMSQVTGPNVEPVSLATMKTHVRVDWDDEDDLISGYITAARSFCEDICGRSFCEQLWDLWIQQWPAGNRIFIPKPPLISVQYVQYTDLNENTSILDPSTYVVNTADDLPEVVLRFGQIWPPIVPSPSRAINVRFYAGYGDDSKVPAPIKQAIMLLVGHWYQNREAVIIGRTATASVRIQETLHALLQRYRITSYTPDPLRP